MVVIGRVDGRRLCRRRRRRLVSSSGSGRIRMSSIRGRGNSSRGSVELRINGGAVGRVDLIAVVDMVEMVMGFRTDMRTAGISSRSHSNCCCSSLLSTVTQMEMDMDIILLLAARFRNGDLVEDLSSSGETRVSSSERGREYSSIYIAKRDEGCQPT